MYNLGCKIFVEFKIECRMMVFLNNYDWFGLKRLVVF